jgi:serine/threonine protein phosphatase PrpC
MEVLSVCASSDTGLVRPQNEDCYLVAGIVERAGSVILELPRSSLTHQRQGLLCAVCDGMGGHARGDMASELVLRSLLERSRGLSAQANASGVEEHLREAVVGIHNEVVEEYRRSPDLTGMGATLTGVFLWPDGLVWFHVGDSRLLRYRGGYLLQITRDHTADAAAGSLLEGSGRSDILLNAIGGGRNATCMPDVGGNLSFEPDDTLILCTDGLTDVLSERAICGVLENTIHDRERVAQLLRAAADGGAPDNVTVVLVSLRRANGGCGEAASGPGRRR